MKVTVTKYLNVRVGKPSVNAPCYQYLAPGSEIQVDGQLYSGDEYDDNDQWYKDEADNYYWSGGIIKIKNSSLIRSKHWWINNFKINELWAFGLKGTGVKIAVLDSGLQFDHPDLNVAKSNTIDKSKSASIGLTDLEGHGTHVTGIVNAIHNDEGSLGIAPEAELFFAKITNDEWGDDYSLLIEGIKWAVKKKVDIISISKGDIHMDANLEFAIEEAYRASIITVCSAGNFLNTTRRSKIMYPAGYKNCIAVGAITKNNTILEQSSISSKIDIMAPGEDILSTYKKSTYKKLSGTSQSAPYISALIALFIQYCRDQSLNYSLEYFKKVLNDSADPISGSDLKIINPKKAYENL